MFVARNQNESPLPDGDNSFLSSVGLPTEKDVSSSAYWKNVLSSLVITEEIKQPPLWIYIHPAYASAVPPQLKDVCTEGIKASQRIGQGGYGVIYDKCMAGYCSQHDAVVKVMHSGQPLEEFQYLVNTHVEVAKRMNGRVPKLHFAIFCSPEQQYVVMDKMHGNSLEKLDFETMLSILPKIHVVLREMMTARVLHGDFKLQNIFLNDDNEIQIFDFDFTELYTFEGTTIANPPTTHAKFISYFDETFFLMITILTLLKAPTVNGSSPESKERVKKFLSAFFNNNPIPVGLILSMEYFAKHNSHTANPYHDKPEATRLTIDWFNYYNEKHNFQFVL